YIEGHALDVFHDHVAGAVLLHVMKHLDDVRVPQRAHLPARTLEFFERERRQRGVVARIDEPGRALARGKAARKEFLDAEPAAHDRVARLVGDPESADAEHPLDAETRDLGTGRQRMRMGPHGASWLQVLFLLGSARVETGSAPLSVLMRIRPCARL